MNVFWMVSRFFKVLLKFSFFSLVVDALGVLLTQLTFALVLLDPEGPFLRPSVGNRS